jgi:flagellar protein FliS
MTNSARALHGYRSTQAQTSSPLELVVMLYDGALRFLADAERGFTTGDAGVRATGISKALAIVNELQSTLDLEKGGAVAAELDRLYEFTQDRLLAATRECRVEPVHEARAVLASLAEAWRALAANGRMETAV